MSRSAVVDSVSQRPPRDTAPAPRQRPVVWTAFVAWAVTFSTANIVSLVGLVAFGLFEDGITPSTFRRLAWPALARIFADDLRRPPIAMTLFALGAAVFGLSALALALVGREPFGRTLRTTVISWPAVVFASLGLVGASDVLEALIKAYHLDRHGGLVPRMSFVMEQLSGSMLVIGLLVFGLLGGVCTELFFRGYLQSRLSARWGPFVGIIIAAALSSTLAYGDPVQTPMLFVVGLALGWVTEQADSVWPAVAAHALRSSFIVLDSAGLIRSGLSPGWRFVAMLVLATSAFVLLQPGSFRHQTRGPA